MGQEDEQCAFLPVFVCVSAFRGIFCGFFSGDHGSAHIYYCTSLYCVLQFINIFIRASYNVGLVLLFIFLLLFSFIFKA